MIVICFRLEKMVKINYLDWLKIKVLCSRLKFRRNPRLVWML